MVEPKKDPDIDLDQIVHDAVASVNSTVPPQNEFSLRVRLALLIAAIIVVANSVLGIYNSLVLRQEVQCNHQLTNALNVVGDQSRDITKQAIDAALGGVNPRTGKPLTRQDLLDIKYQYDIGFAANSQNRAKLLSTTCNDGSTPTPHGSSGSSGS